MARSFKFRFIAAILLAAISLVFSDCLSAKKIPIALCGRVYLASGDSIVSDKELHIGVPTGKKKLDIIDKAYTKKSNISRKLTPEEVDSAVLWVPTAPYRPHTFRFIDGYGWCFQLEYNPYIAVYCFASKGYHFAGNGGIWMRGKAVLLVVKDDMTYNFGKPHKKVNTPFTHQLEGLVADDPKLLNYIKSAKGRRDKVLRSLGQYNPTNH